MAVFNILLICNLITTVPRTSIRRCGSAQHQVRHQKSKDSCIKDIESHLMVCVHRHVHSVLISGAFDSALSADNVELNPMADNFA